MSNDKAYVIYAEVNDEADKLECFHILSSMDNEVQASNLVEDMNDANAAANISYDMIEVEKNISNKDAMGFVALYNTEGDYIPDEPEDVEEE